MATTFKPTVLKKKPGFLACQLKTRVYSHKVLLCARKTSRKLPVERKSVERKQSTSCVNTQSDDFAETCHCIENDNMKLWRGTVEKENQRIGVILGERSCPKENFRSRL